MADLTSRRDHWSDYLPQNLQQSINTNPLLNALGRALQRPAPDLTRGIDHDQYGSVSDRNWLLQAAQGPAWLDRQDPAVQDGANKLGLLANFLGPPMTPKKYQFVGFRGMRRPDSGPRADVARHLRSHEEDGFGIWFGDRPEIANSYATTSIINNTPERQAFEAARQKRFKRQFGTKQWDGDLEALAAIEMDMKSGRTLLADDGANVAKNNVLFDNPLVIDFNGGYYNALSKEWPINAIAEHARRNGFDALVARNVMDYGDLAFLPPWARSAPGTSVSVFSRDQVVPWWQSTGAIPFDVRSVPGLSLRDLPVRDLKR